MEILQNQSKKENLKNNIIIIGINYYPEDSAIGLYTTQKAEFLVLSGYNVTVITGFPYYPQWKINDDYTNKPFLFKENINGVNIYRFKQYVPPNPTFIKRIFHMLSFTFGNFINLFRVSNPDIVISIVPFTTSALLGWFLKLRYKAKLWIHIQDFEFDAAIDSGLLSGNKKWIVSLLIWIEKKVLNKANIISTISHGMINKLNEKTKTKSFYLTNWIDVSLFQIKTINKHKYLSSEKFKILYSGNIGAKQDWNLFFNFLDALKKVNTIEVVLVGEGAEKENVVSKLSKYSFVKHYNLVPYEELPLLLSSADLHILFQKENVIDTVMPSKLLGMMASERPSIVTGNIKSEVAKVYEDSKGGYFFSGDSLQQVIDCLQKLQMDNSLCLQLGQNAKKYVTKQFSKDQVLNNFLEQLKQL
jgi:colanic acid biosynthesis glycosyl transferase WcaI